MTWLCKWPIGLAVKLTVASFAFAFAALLGLGEPAGASEARLEWVFATQSGEPAFDGDPYGGNPFATAFIAALEPSVTDAGGVMLDHTLRNSDFQQVPDIDALGEQVSLTPKAGEEASALVIVFADYGSDEGLISLPGAAFDAARVGAALAKSGYTTRIVVARTAQEYRRELSAFSQLSKEADRALIYTTGHGTEVSGEIYLIPPEADGRADVLNSSIKLSELGPLLQARTSNRIFYAGCRDNPLQL